MVHQVAWSLVLLQGLILFPVALDLPVLPAASESNVAIGLANEPSSSVSLGPPGVVRPDDHSQSTAAPTAGLRSDEVNEFGANDERATGGSSASVAIRTGSIEQPITVALKPVSDPPRTEFSWSLLAGVVWCVGITLLTTRAVWSYVRFLAEVRNATDAPAVWDSQWQSLLALHTGQQAKMLCHETLGPMLCRTPAGNVLLVPEELWDGLSLKQRDGILRHELGHLQRRDIWTGLLARFVAALHWFNPLVWLAVGRLNESLEWACDERAVDQTPEQAPAFAKALLEMVQPAGVPVFGTTSVQGSPLGVRIRRLLRRGASDSLAKRVSVFALLSGLLVAGTLQVNLTQRAGAANVPTTNLRQQEPGGYRITEFASRIVGSTDLIKSFTDAIHTPAGQAALLEQVGPWNKVPEGGLNANAARWFQQNFVKQNGKHVFRPDRQQYRQELLESAALYQQNATRLEAAMQEISEGIGDKRDEALLTRRFLETPNASYAFLNGRLKRILQPDWRVVADILNQYFVRQSDGVYHVRQDRTAEAREVLSRLKRCMKAKKLLAETLKDYAGDMVLPEGRQTNHEENKALWNSLRLARRGSSLWEQGLGGQAKLAFEDPLFAAFRSVERLFHSEQPVFENAEDLSRQLDYMTKDTAAGLVLNRDAKHQVWEWLEPFAKLKHSYSRILPAVRTFVSRMSTTSPLEKDLKEALSSQVGAVWIASALNAGLDPDASDALIRLVWQEICEPTAPVRQVLESEAKPIQGGDTLQVTLDIISKAHGISIHSDKLALEDAGIESLDSITVNSELGLNEISLRSALKIILEQLDGVDETLTFVVRQGGLVITTQDQADFDGEDIPDGEFKVEQIEQMFADVRRLRREARMFSALVASVDDEEVKKAFETPAGVLAAKDQIASTFSAGTRDAFSRWIDTHFVDTADGWAPRDSAVAMMQGVLESAKQIEEQQKDDGA
jgi:beta-lactamase regulating signal transducer with metallopeptidase domain